MSAARLLATSLHLLLPGNAILVDNQGGVLEVYLKRNWFTDLGVPSCMCPGTLRNHRKPFRSGDEARKVLLGMKCEEDTLEDIKCSLSYLIKERPVEVYGIVLDLLRKSVPREVAEGMEDIARSAARNSLLDPPLGTWTPQTKIGLDDYTRFTSYRCKCRARLLGFLTIGKLMENIGTEWIWFNTKCGVCPLTSNSFVMSGAALGTAKYPAMWWVTCLEGVVASVRDFPCEKAFKNERIWISTLQALARECPTCHRAAAKEFPFFREKLVDEVTRIIDDVELEIKL